MLMGRTSVNPRPSGRCFSSLMYSTKHLEQSFLNAFFTVIRGNTSLEGAVAAAGAPAAAAAAAAARMPSLRSL